MLLRVVLACLAIAGISFGSAASAENLFPFPYFKSKAPLDPLLHPVEASAMDGPLSGRLFKPAGAGPFPAVILEHTCAGVSEHLRAWADEAVKRGYVAYVIDSFGPRGVLNACGKVTKVVLTDGMIDVLDAARHLGKMPFVDPKRVALIGFSWGGGVALFANSEWLRGEPRFADYTDVSLGASVAVYPSCYLPKTKKIPEVSMIQPDVKVPTLALLAERDHEIPNPECVTRFEEAKKRGANYAWQFMKDATHGWDAAEKNGLKTTMPWMDQGGTYVYDPTAAAQSRAISFDFLTERMQ